MPLILATETNPGKAEWTDSSVLGSPTVDFVFAPGETPSGNIYDDFLLLYAALSTLPVYVAKRIQFVSANFCTIPANVGGYDFTNVTFQGNIVPIKNVGDETVEIFIDPAAVIAPNGQIPAVLRNVTLTFQNGRTVPFWTVTLSNRYTFKLENAIMYNDDVNYAVISIEQLSGFKPSMKFFLTGESTLQFLIFTDIVNNRISPIVYLEDKSEVTDQVTNMTFRSTAFVAVGARTSISDSQSGNYSIDRLCKYVFAGAGSILGFDGVLYMYHYSIESGAYSLGVPELVGQTVSITRTQGVANAVVTAPSIINQVGNTIMTFTAVNSTAVLTSVVSTTGNLRWQVVSTDTVTLS